MKTGIDFRFWAKLHTSLKKLMREVIRCPDSALQKKHLSKVYAWFMRKLEIAGMASG